ncbi:hypothetical protein ACFX14_037651 [Malus domestica]
MLFSIMETLRRSNDELIPLGIIMSSFVSDKSQTKGVLPLKKAIEVGVKTVYQDSMKLELADLTTDLDA